MGSALVVGDRGSGLTTFVGLLYAAQLRLGTEEKDEFRFSADRETIRQLEGIYGELVAGRFPEWDADWDTHPLSFVFGFRSGTLPRLRGARVHHDGGFDTFRVHVGGISVETVSEIAEHDAILEDTTRRLFRSPVVLPLVDASRLLPLVDDDVRPPLERYDRRLAATLDLLSRFLAASRRRRRRTLYPLFVVTKFDQCPAATLARFRIPAGPPASWTAEARKNLGEQLLAAYLPETGRRVRSATKSSATNIAPPQWFFSSLQLVPGPEGARIARRSRIPVGAFEPEYPFEEYRTLIRQLATLAHRLPSWDDDS